MKRLRHSKKGYMWKCQFSKEKGWNHVKVFYRYKSEYPDYTIKKLTRKQLIDAYVRDRMKKWDKKHPCPAPGNDLFKEEYMTVWNNSRKAAEIHIRDFAVSRYDKLEIRGNRVDKKNGCMKSIKIAEIRDIGGKGHNIAYPHLRENDTLYITASKIAQKIMDADRSILDADLISHSKNQKRPLSVIRAPLVLKRAAQGQHLSEGGLVFPHSTTGDNCRTVYADTTQPISNY